MKTVRRQRLNELLASPRFNGDRAAFCQSAGLTKGRLSQLLDPNEAFGDVAAKNLAESLDLPAGWFDTRTHTSHVTYTPPENQPVVAVTRIQQAPIATNDVANVLSKLALNPRARALIEDICTRSMTGTLDDDDIKWLHDSLERTQKQTVSKPQTIPPKLHQLLNAKPQASTSDWAAPPNAVTTPHEPSTRPI